MIHRNKAYRIDDRELYKRSKIYLKLALHTITCLMMLRTSS